MTAVFSQQNIITNMASSILFKPYKFSCSTFKQLNTLLILSILFHSPSILADSNTIKNRSALCPPVEITGKTVDESSPTQIETEQNLLALRGQGNETLGWIEDPSANSCGGYYRSPPTNSSLNSPEEHPINMSADAISHSNDGDTILTDNVLFYQGDTHFYCDKLNYNTQTTQAQLTGGVEFWLPGMLVLADSAEYNEQDGKANFSNTEFVIHEINARGKASNLALTHTEQQQSLLLEQSYFSVCPPTRNDWALRASKIDIDYESGWGKAWHTRILIKDVPIFYLPYFDFPVDNRRKTGLLFPSIGGGSDGLEYIQSYYINLAPNYDLTITPHYIQSHGLLNSVEGRYKNRFSEWNIGTSYISNDKKIDHAVIDETPGLNKNDGKRWSFVLNETGDFGDHWRHKIDYTAVSDVAFLRDWGGSGLQIRKQNTLEREARIDYLSDNWQVTLRAVDFETLEIDPNTGKQKDTQYNLLPELTLDYRGSVTPWQINPIALARISQFNYSEQMPQAQKIEAIRSYAQTGLNYTLSSQAYKLSNNIKVKGLYYDYASDNIKNNPIKYTDNNGVAIATYNLDSRLLFERNTYTIENTGYKQTLTPRLFYYYAPFTEQTDQPDFDTSELNFNYSQAFREERFSGYDRISDSNKISLGLETAIFQHSDGSQLFNFGLAQTFYFNDRRVLINETDADKKSLDASLNLTSTEIDYRRAYNKNIEKRYFRSYSDLAARSQYYINTENSIIFDAVYDTQSNDLERHTLFWHYVNDSGSIANIGYAFERALPELVDTDGDSISELIHQNTQSSYVSLYTPLSSINPALGQSWSVYGRLNWDLEKNETIDNLAGLKYESCCWSVLFAVQRERRIYDSGVKVETWENSTYDNRWFIEFELKGLGGMTHSIMRLLEDSIEGFKK